MKRFPCRCKKCNSRVTLKKEPWKYVKERKCFCGGELRVDYYRKNKENKSPCRCWGYPFPHRKGGGVWCEHHPVGPSDADYEERYGAT